MFLQFNCIVLFWPGFIYPDFISLIFLANFFHTINISIELCNGNFGFIEALYVR